MRTYVRTSVDPHGTGAFPTLAPTRGPGWLRAMSTPGSGVSITSARRFGGALVVAALVLLSLLLFAPGRAAAQEPVPDNPPIVEHGIITPGYLPAEGGE